ARQEPKFEPGSEGIVTNLFVEMARIACIDQQIAGRVTHQNASRRRSEGKVAECFSSLNPAGGESRQRRDGRRYKRTRGRWRQGSSAKVECIKRSTDGHKSDYKKKR